MLSYIRQINDGVTTTDIQKLIFLYTMKEKAEYYEFVPYRYGPYSFQLAEDIDILYQDKYLSKDGSRIHAIGEYQQEFLFSITPERGNNLVKKAYREYPYYAINSEIINLLFNEDEAGFLKKKTNVFTTGSNTVYNRI